MTYTRTNLTQGKMSKFQFYVFVVDSMSRNFSGPQVEKIENLTFSFNGMSTTVGQAAPLYRLQVLHASKSEFQKFETSRWRGSFTDLSYQCAQVSIFAYFTAYS